MSEIMKVSEGQYEKEILSYLLKNKDNIRKTLDYGVKPKWFRNEQLKDFYNVILDQFESKSIILSKDIYMSLVRDNNDITPEEYISFDRFYDFIYEYCEDDDNFIHYLEEFRQQNVHIDVCELFDEYLKENKEIGNKGALDFLKSKIDLIGYEDVEKKYKVMDYFEDVDIQEQDIIRRKEDPDFYAGVKTGFKKLDEAFNGYERGALNIIVALTGTGKSTIASNIAYNQAVLYRKNVLVLSLEDNAILWCHKITSSETKIPLTTMLRGKITDEEIEKIKKSKKDRSKNNGKYVIIELEPRKFTVGEIENIINKTTQTWKPDIVYLDQISLVSPKVKRGQRFDIEYGDVSKDLISLAKRMDVPFVVNAQANRDAIKRQKGERIVDINIENLAESSHHTQDAASVIALQTNDKDGSLYILRILKQRYGRVNEDIPIFFQKETCTFVDADEFNDDISTDDMFNGAQPDSLYRNDEEKNKLDALIGKFMHEDDIQPQKNDSMIINASPLNNPQFIFGEKTDLDDIDRFLK